MLRAMVEESIILVEFIYCACGCGKTRPKHDKRGIIRKYISGHNYHKLGDEHPNHKRRKGWIDEYGYKHISIIDENGKIKWVREHVYVYEQYYKCCIINKWGAVHHKNIDDLPEWENKHDNRIENLQGIMQSDHAKHHGLGIDKRYTIPDNRYCIICRSKETHKDKKERSQWYEYQDGFICFQCYRNLKYHENKNTISQIIREDKSNNICLICGFNKTEYDRNKGVYKWYNFNNGKICRRCYRKMKRMSIM